MGVGPLSTGHVKREQVEQNMGASEATVSMDTRPDLAPGTKRTTSGSGDSVQSSDSRSTQASGKRSRGDSSAGASLVGSAGDLQRRGPDQFDLGKEDASLSDALYASSPEGREVLAAVMPQVRFLGAAEATGEANAVAHPFASPAPDEVLNLVDTDGEAPEDDGADPEWPWNQNGDEI